MAKGARELAWRLAETAREIEREHGDVPAQALVYLLLARRWGEPVDAGDLADPDVVRRIEDALDLEDLDAIAADYAASGRDPVVYFHEEFIRACSPQQARMRGVHYTPPEVVTYIVRAVASALEISFDCEPDESVVIDPCCGVGTFLRHITRETGWRPKMVGYELIGPTAAVASRIVPDAEIVCADFLSLAQPESGVEPPHSKVTVILGNPPYSGHSANAGKIAELMADYREGLNEKNPKWLQDDYVKFIRQAQHWVDKAGRGIVAFITNHSFIFNPTFRAMRESLMSSFDEIHVLDLGGNAKLARGNDENVFPIQMGVAITIFIKSGKAGSCRVRYASLSGTRESKLAALASMDCANTPWQDVNPVAPFRLFTPTDDQASSTYAQYVPLADVFERSSVGFVTSRDAFAVAFDREALLERIADLRDSRVSPESIRERYPVGDLDIERARGTLLADLYWEDHAVEVLYRPFDRRWAYLSTAVMERPRLPFMEDLLRENLALAIGRAGHATGSDEWDVVFVTDCPTDLNLFRRGGAMLFPRYVYENGQRRSNVRIVKHDPDLVIPYIYAVLHSRVYRERFADLLAIDFPRIPFTSDATLFNEIAETGQQLITAHLRAGTGTGPYANTIRTDHGTNVVGTDPDGNTVGADPCVRPSITIGGYELPRKHVKDRGHHDEPQVKHIEAAIAETKRLMSVLDPIVSTVLG